jgi:hypothetical protein
MENNPTNHSDDSTPDVSNLLRDAENKLSQARGELLDAETKTIEATEDLEKIGRELKRDEGHDEIIHYELDTVRYKTLAKELTPRQIMDLANPRIDPSNHYLVLVREKRQQESFQGKVDQAIPLEDDMEFITNSTGATTVS